MKLTLRHYYHFQGNSSLQGDSLLSPAAWDNLRSEQDQSSAFFMPTDRDRWLQIALETPGLPVQAREIAALISWEGFTSVVSVGVGRALLEYHLKQQLPKLPLICSEFSPQVVDRLRKVFLECERVDCHDFTQAGWPRPPGRPLYLLNRVDTELTDEQWSAVFSRLHAEGVQDILMVATSFLTPRVLACELKRHLMSWVIGRRLTFAGYLRTKSAFMDLWEPHYQVVRKVPAGALTGFLLTRHTAAH